jgi:pentatricopeptide repeat protein
MAKYIVYFSHEEFGYKEFEAKDIEEADEIVERMESEGHFPDDFDRVKDEGWVNQGIEKQD